MDCSFFIGRGVTVSPGARLAGCGSDVFGGVADVGGRLDGVAGERLSGIHGC